MPRCGSIVLEPMLCEPTLDDPILVRSEVAGADGRLLVLGGVNGRYPPRVPLCVEDGWLLTVRLAELFISRFETVPALGLCILLLAVVP